MSWKQYIETIPKLTKQQLTDFSGTFLQDLKYPKHETPAKEWWGICPLIDLDLFFPIQEPLSPLSHPEDQ